MSTADPAHGPAFRHLVPVNFSKPVEPARDVGERGELIWVPVDRLVIDESYQRDVGTRGRRTIRAILEDFDWSRFDPVMIAPAGDMPGHYAVVDGQHRATAALMHPEIQRVPAYLHLIDQQGQARAFRAVNHVVTAMTPLQLHAAAIAAGDEEALRLEGVARDAGVTVLRYPKSAWSIQPGETMAVGSLYALLKRHGGVILHRALFAMRQAWPDMPGLKASHFKAVVALTVARPDLDAAALAEFLAGTSGDDLFDLAASRAKQTGVSTTAAAADILVRSSERHCPRKPETVAAPVDEAAADDAPAADDPPAEGGNGAQGDVALARLGAGEGLTDAEILELLEEELGAKRSLAWLDTALGRSE